jgi:hypothetical protein
LRHGEKEKERGERERERRLALKFPAISFSLLGFDPEINVL